MNISAGNEYDAQLQIATFNLPFASLVALVLGVNNGRAGHVPWFHFVSFLALGLPLDMSNFL